MRGTRRRPTRPSTRPGRPARDPNCLIWLLHPDHLCQTAAAGSPDGTGGRCAVWARVRAARHHAAGPEESRDLHQVDAQAAAMSLVEATRELLEAVAHWTVVDRQLSGASSSAAAALLRADQLAALAGWAR